MLPSPTRRRPANMYRRRRAVTACQACRARKTKCDNMRPVCGFCARNAAQCVYDDAATGGDHSTYVNADRVTTALREGSKLTCMLSKSFDPASLAILDRVNHVASLLEAWSSTPPSNPTNVTGSPALGAENISGSVFHEPENNGTLDAPAALSSLINCESILRWPILQPVFPNTQSIALDMENEADIPTHPSELVDNRIALGRGVQEEDLLPLSKRFLAYVHVKNPVLDVADYKRTVKAAAKDGLAWDGSSCLVVSTSRPLDTYLNSCGYLPRNHQAYLMRSCIPVRSISNGAGI